MITNLLHKLQRKNKSDCKNIKNYDHEKYFVKCKNKKTILDFI